MIQKNYLHLRTILPYITLHEALSHALRTV